MGLKLFSPGGIDQKSSHLVRDPNSLVDARNISLSTHKEYQKRPGTITDSNFSGDTYNDVVFIKSLDEYFFRNGSDYYSYKNGVKKVIPIPFVDPTLDSTSNINGTEYLKTFIFTHDNKQAGTFKYDGNSLYLAGLPTPAISVNNPGTGAFLLSFYDFIDNQGNEIFGPSTITPIQINAGLLSVSTLKDTGFYEGYLKVAGSSGVSNYTLDASSRSITYVSKSNDIVVGSKIAVRTSSLSRYAAIQCGNLDGSVKSFYEYVLLEVESIVGFVITFTAASFLRCQINIISNASQDFNIMSNLIIRNYVSDQETTGYSQSTDYNFSIDNSSVTNTFTISLSLSPTVNIYLLSDIYDINTSKLRPPKCKFIKAYGSQIVCGNVISFWDFKNKENTYTNNDLIMYSDIFNGDLGENFSEQNRQLIGDTFDGEVTGLERTNNSMLVFKERSAYSLDGVLSPGQYSIRKIETNQIGCFSNKSILSIDSMIIFHGQDGLYAIDGYKCKKITDKLDPFFYNLHKTVIRSVMDNDNDQYLFFTQNGVVVFNYMYSHWFIWNGIDASKGSVVDNTVKRVVRMFGSSECKKFQLAKNDGPDPLNVPHNKPINAWIQTHWFDLGEPSLLKNVIDARFFSLNNNGQVLSARLYHDWDINKNKPSFIIDFSDPSRKTLLRKLDIQKAQSFSFIIGNNIEDEDFSLSGFEINCVVSQDKDKNV
jgi:hypothetical protein